ncbi:FecCD family ABC transporter permease [Corynebacterium ciconiae]|uniref:FecCD family ABC transporter permease n=1 Tax=Corynebacterium ciconiae TaxID=227319 RepID=UPI0031345862
MWRVRAFVATLALAAGIMVLAGLSVSIVGDYRLNILSVLAGHGSRAEQLVVYQWRLPRTATAIVVGIALGLSGALTQSVTRNPLASPDILGITSGASAAAVTVLTLGAATWSLPLAALVGACVTALAIWALAFRRSLDPYRLVLCGIIVTALLQSYINFLMIRADIRDATSAQFWLTGSLNAAHWGRALPLCVVIIALLPLIGWMAHQLKATSLGEDSAASLGVRVNASYLTFLGVAVLVAALAVSAAGPIGFVAFVAPQLALRVSGVSTPPLLASALMGAALVLAADITTQTLLPTELPVGLVTSALGGLFLIYLLRKVNA